MISLVFGMNRRCENEAGLMGASRMNDDRFPKQLKSNENVSREVWVHAPPGIFGF